MVKGNEVAAGGGNPHDDVLELSLVVRIEFWKEFMGKLSTSGFK